MTTEVSEREQHVLMGRNFLKLFFLKTKRHLSLGGRGYSGGK